MYENVGKKIKTLAIIVFAIDFLAGVIAGIALLSEGRDRYTVWGIVLLLGGPLIGYIFSLLIYGFGELICKSVEIENNTRGEEKEKTLKQTVVETQNETHHNEIPENGVVEPEDSYRKGQYDKAIKKMGLDTYDGYEEAEKIFKSLSVFLDSEEKADYCRREMEDIRIKKRLYYITGIVFICVITILIILQSR